MYCTLWCLVSFTSVTPLDVVKVRLQAQSNPSLKGNYPFYAWERTSAFCLCVVSVLVSMLMGLAGWHLSHRRMEACSSCQVDIGWHAEFL